MKFGGIFLPRIRAVAERGSSQGSLVLLVPSLSEEQP